MKKLDYKTLKRRKRGREGVAFLWRVISRIAEAHCKIIPASNPMGYIPEWDSEDNRQASILVNDLRWRVEHQEAYARNEM